MAQELPFDPFPFLEDPHRQTILSSLCNVLREPESVQSLVSLHDGDQISLEITTPGGWKPTDPTVFLVHGLCGSHRSPYLVRLARKFQEEGVRAVRLNMRGCGSGEGLAKQMYHGGRSEDVFEAIKHLKLATPLSPIFLVGFSLGGNISLKMVGELGSLAKEFLSAVIAVSPPVDLYASVVLLGKPENAIYENYFVGQMCDNVRYRHGKFSDLPPVELPDNLRIYEFDQLYTAPFYGFRDARDYYDKCSSLSVIGDIEIPCRILFSEDDPIVAHSSLDGMDLPGNIRVFKTRKGGHMGYLAHPGKGSGVYWLDGVIADWVLNRSLGDGELPVQGADREDPEQNRAADERQEQVSDGQD